MDSLKGTLISIMIFALFVIPALLDVMSMSIAVSQLNKVGAEMIQVIGSSSEYDERTKKAIEVAGRGLDKGKGEKGYAIEVKLDKTDYKLGDEVELTLKKNVTQFFNCEADTGKEGCNADFETKEKVMITKRGTD